VILAGDIGGTNTRLAMSNSRPRAVTTGMRWICFSAAKSGCTARTAASSRTSITAASLYPSASHTAVSARPSAAQSSGSSTSVSFAARMSSSSRSPRRLTVIRPDLVENLTEEPVIRMWPEAIVA